MADDNKIIIKIGANPTAAEQTFKQMVDSMQRSMDKLGGKAQSVSSKLKFVGVGNTANVQAPNANVAGQSNTSGSLLGVMRNIQSGIEKLGVSLVGQRRHVIQAPQDTGGLKKAVSSLLTSGESVGFVVASNPSALAIWMRSLGYSHKGMANHAASGALGDLENHSRTVLSAMMDKSNGYRINSSTARNVVMSKSTLQADLPGMLPILDKQYEMQKKIYEDSQKQVEVEEEWLSKRPQGTSGVTNKSRNAHAQTKSDEEAKMQAAKSEMESIDAEKSALSIAAYAESPVGSRSSGKAHASRSRRIKNILGGAASKFDSFGKKVQGTISSDPFTMAANGLSGVPIVGAIAGIAGAIEGIAKGFIPTAEAWGRGYAQSSGGNYSNGQFNAYESAIKSGATKNLRSVNSYTEGASTFMQASGQTTMALVFQNTSAASQFARAMGVDMQQGSQAAGQFSLYGSGNVPGTLSNVLGATLMSGINPTMFLQGVLGLDQTGAKYAPNVSSSGNAALSAGLDVLGKQTGLSFLQGSRGTTTLENMNSAIQNPISGSNELYTYKATQAAYAATHGGQMPSMLTNIGLQQEGPIGWGKKSPKMLGAYLNNLSSAFGNSAWGQLMFATQSGLSVSELQSLQKKTGGNWLNLTSKDLASASGASSNPANAAKSFATTLAGSAASVNTALSIFSADLGSVSLKITANLITSIESLYNKMMKLTDNGKNLDGVLKLIKSGFSALAGYIGKSVMGAIKASVKGIESATHWLGSKLVAGSKDLYNWFEKISGVHTGKNKWKTAGSNLLGAGMSLLGGNTSQSLIDAGSAWHDIFGGGSSSSSGNTFGGVSSLRLSEMKRNNQAFGGDIASAALNYGGTNSSMIARMMQAIQTQETGYLSPSKAATAYDPLGKGRGVFQLDSSSQYMNGMNLYNPQQNADAAVQHLNGEIQTLINRGIIPSDWSTTKNHNLQMASIADIFQGYNMGAYSKFIQPASQIQNNINGNISSYAQDAMRYLKVISGSTGTTFQFSVTLPNGQKVNIS